MYSDKKPALLEADGIRKLIGRRVLLQDIYIGVQQGGVTGLLGRNGCGKSTLLHIVYGLIHADTRSVRWNGRYVSRAYREKDFLCFLPQASFVPGEVTPRQLFEWYGCDFRGAVAEFAGLADLLDQRIETLSTGERRLFEIIAVLTSSSAFVFLDEPFAGIMPLYQEIIAGQIRKLKSAKGILISDHRFREVVDLSDRLYFLDNYGRTRELKNPKEDLKDFGYHY